MGNVNKKSKKSMHKNSARDGKQGLQLWRPEKLDEAIVKAKNASKVHSSKAAVIRAVMEEWCMANGYL